MDMGQRAVLLLILLCGLALRLGWGLSRGSTDGDLEALPDQLQYLQIARNMTAGRGVMLLDERFHQRVYAYRMPGYPAFIAALGNSPRAVRVAQGLIDTASVLAMFLLATRLVGGRGALVAAGLVGLNPLLISFSGLLLTETCYISTLIWGMWLLVSGKWLRWSAGVVLLAAGGLLRPSGVGLGVLIVGISPLLNRRLWPAYQGLVRVCLATLIGAAICAVVLLPWAYRNASHPQLGRWVWLTTNDGITLYDGLNALADGGSAQEKFMPSLRGKLSGMTEIERDEFLRSAALDWAGDHFGRALVLAGKKMIRTWSPVPLSADRMRPIYVVVGLAYFVPFWILVLMGVASRGLACPIKAWLLLPAVYFTLLHAISVGSMRYRLPADVPMSILAAAAVAMCFSLRCGKSGRPVKHGQISDQS